MVGPFSILYTGVCRCQSQIPSVCFSLILGVLRKFLILGNPPVGARMCLVVPVQFSSVIQLCLTLCDPMDCSMPGLPVHHQLLGFTQIHVRWVSDAIQTSHPLSSPSPPAFNLSQHKGFSNKSILHIRWPKYWCFSFNISLSSEHPGLIFRIDWFDPLAVQGTLEFSPTVQKHQFFDVRLSLWSDSHIHSRLLEKP